MEERRFSAAQRSRIDLGFSPRGRLPPRIEIQSDRKGTDAVIEFKLPELGENISQGDLVRLMIAPGAAVSEGQSVMELETDKAVLEVPSSVTGTVGEIRVKEGDKLKVGQVIFTVENGAIPNPKPAARTVPPPAVVPTVQASKAP